MDADKKRTCIMDKQVVKCSKFQFFVLVCKYYSFRKERKIIKECLIFTHLTLPKTWNSSSTSLPVTREYRLRTWMQ